MIMLARASLAALFVFSLLAGFSGAAQAEEVGTLRGKLWLVSNTNLNATRPMPKAAPDATFVTRHVSFEMSAPYAGSGTSLNNVNNTVESFLASAHPDAAPPVKDLAFSGLFNSFVGAVVDSNTPVVNSTSGSDGTYGTYMIFEGRIELANGQSIVIAHDNGVSLWIDGYRYLLMGVSAPLRYKRIVLPDSPAHIRSSLFTSTNRARAS
jgi:hypothetical protein